MIVETHPDLNGDPQTFVSNLGIPEKWMVLVNPDHHTEVIGPGFESWIEGRFKLDSTWDTRDEALARVLEVMD